VKVALHSQTNDNRNHCTPTSINRAVEEDEIDAIRAVLDKYMPTLNGPLVQSTTCMYTMTPDEHFLIDFHPKTKNVILASPCSGHGFKVHQYDMHNFSLSQVKHIYA
jgi:glycine/D-amino acid oxidase-like deaminating enzyme